MSIEVRLPPVGFSTREVRLAEFLVADGATVERGQPLYMLELDKTVQEMEAPASGTLRILARPGKVYEVGTLICEIV